MSLWFFLASAWLLVEGQMVFDFDQEQEENQLWEHEDGTIASFFDNVVIPADRQRKVQLDPRIIIGKDNATAVARKCHPNVNKRILEADHRLIIIGAGPAGLSAGIYAARAGMNPLIISKAVGKTRSTKNTGSHLRSNCSVSGQISKFLPFQS